jgi:F1F0 ATPase subunit 2
MSMTFPEPLTFGLALLAGLGIGAFFFGGLWWTVTKSISAQKPKFLLLFSFIVRIGISLPAIYFAAANNFARLIICLTGFFMARLIMVRVVRKRDVKM